MEEAKIEVQNNNFELRSRKYFLTYAQCELPCADVLEGIKTAFNGLGMLVVSWVVARELHADDQSHHIHAYIELENKMYRKRTTARFLDLGDHHPNIQTDIRSVKAVARYVTKDGDFITNIMERVKAAQEEMDRGSKVDVGKMILAGSKLTDIVKKYPQYCIGYSRLKLDIQALEADTKEIERGRGPVGFWIGGWSGVGKTHFSTVTVPALTGLSYYDKPNNPKFWPGFNGEAIISCQDVDSSWGSSLEPFKSWADGYPFTGESKGGSFRTRAQLFLVTSNLTLDEWLTECKVREDHKFRQPWLRRFKEYWIEERGELGALMNDIVRFLKENKIDEVVNI